MSVKAFVGIKDAASAGLGKIKDLLGTLAKGATIAVGLAGAGAGALLNGSLNEGAALQQSIGGVETLFKGDAGTVKKNADAAFATAGLSANEYMETVTGFSASLLQSLGGDTNKAAGIADMAIVDMSDNANKFGSSMESIQNAYQGFAKQNYTMLDNLKLGYGGTKGEMERLLKDATAISGVKYDLDSLSDVYEAIHVIQDNLGVTGTTAEEASKTFSGSFAAMKASAQNLLGNLAIGGDVAGSMGQLVSSASTFLFQNALPMIGNVFKAIPDAVRAAAPQIKESAGVLVNTLRDGITELLPSGMGEALFSSFDGAIATISPVLSDLMGMFNRVAPAIAETWGGAFSESGGLLKGFVNIVSGAMPLVESIILGVNDAFASLSRIVAPAVQAITDLMPTVVPAVQAFIDGISSVIDTFVNIFISAIPVVEGIIEGFSTFIQGVMPVVSSIYETVGGIIQQVLSVIGNHMGLFQGIVQAVIAVVTATWNTLAPVIRSVVNLVLTIVNSMLNGIQAVFNVLSPYISSIWSAICSFFSSASQTISSVVSTLESVFRGLLSVVSSVFGAIASAVSSAISSVIGCISRAVSAISGFVSKIGGALGKAKSFIGSVGGGIGHALGFAYGKDRVPYNNYPAVLHAGEKVLTRNQADQYDRVMSTRGVELAPTVQPVEASSGGGAQADPVEHSRDTASGIVLNNTSNFTIQVDKGIDLGDERALKELGYKLSDYTVQAMVQKFNKILPNMA